MEGRGHVSPCQQLLMPVWWLHLQHLNRSMMSSASPRSLCLAPCLPYLLLRAAQNPKNRLDMHEAKEGTAYVKGLSTVVVKNEAEIAAVLEVGAAPWQPFQATPLCCPPRNGGLQNRPCVLKHVVAARACGGPNTNRSRVVGPALDVLKRCPCCCACRRASATAPWVPP